MRDSGAAAFISYTTTFEGRVPCLYVDIKQIVTTGLGCALFDVSDALQLPWTIWRSGSSIPGVRAMPAQIQEEYFAVKSDTDLARQGWRAAMAVTVCRLSNDEIDKLAMKRVGAMESTLHARFPFWDALPAAMQLCCLSLAWANGAHFNFPKFQHALEIGNYASYSVGGEILPDGSVAAPGVLLPGCCAFEGVSDPNAGGVHNAGIIPRNDAQRRLCEAAQVQKDAGGDPDVLVGWPG